MTTYEHAPASPFQLKLKSFCVRLETKFETRINRLGFSLRMLLVAAIFYALYYAGVTWFADSAWPIHVVLSLGVAATSFWTILQIVRRFHDMGQTGGLFWAIAVPYWALWKMIGFFPELWYVWLVLCAWPIKLTLSLFFKAGTEGANRYEARSTQV